MQPQRVIWVLTQPVDLRDSSKWDRLEALGKELIGRIGGDGYIHEVVSSRVLFPQVVAKLKGMKFSTIVNVAANNFTQPLRDTFPDTPVAHFPISRIRELKR